MGAAARAPINGDSHPEQPLQFSEAMEAAAAGGSFHGNATFGVDKTPKVINRREARRANVGHQL